MILMSVSVSFFPIVFHDTEELSEFLLHCGKYLYWFDGQDVFIDDEYVLTIRVYWSQHAFCEYITYQRSPDFLGAPAGGRI